MLGQKLIQRTKSTFINVSLASYVGTFSSGRSSIGLQVKPDGTKLFITEFNATTPSVYRYSLSGGLITTASYDSIVKSFSGGTANLGSAVYISSTGSQVYISKPGTTDYLAQHNLSTPWDITTATYSSEVTLTMTNPYGIYQKSDGTNIYIINGNTTPYQIFQYSMPTPYSIIGLSNTAVLSYATQTTGTSYMGVTFTDDGSSLLISDRNTDYIYQYNMTVPWNINTAVYVTSLNIAGITTDAYQLAYYNKNIYVCDSVGNIYQWLIP